MSDAIERSVERAKVLARIQWELALEYRESSRVDIDTVMLEDGKQVLCNLVTIIDPDGSVTLKVDEPPVQKLLTDGEGMV